MAIPTSRKGPTRRQLTQLKKFVMENGLGQSITQVDSEPAIKQLAEEAARALTIPLRQSSSHTHQGQGSVEGFHQTLFSQVRAIRFDLVDRCNLQTPDNVPEALLPWILQHACFTINSGFGRHQANHSQQVGHPEQGEKDRRHLLGKTTNSGEHIIATMGESGKAFYTRSLTRLTPELQWDKRVFDKIVIPQLDISMNEDYVEEEYIGKTIIDEFFTKTRLNEKQSAHRLYNNNKEQRQLPPRSLQG
eukprot:6015951-Amphidinium_carterae.1